MDMWFQLWGSAGRIEQSIAAVVIMAAAYFFFRTIIIKRLGKIAAKTSNDLDDRLVHFMRQFLWVIALFFTVALVLKINHVRISPLLAGAGIFGVALGFAAKETIADILSGIFLIADRPVRVGDRVKIENFGRHWGAWGDIVDIGLRRTRIRNTDGVVVNYPNSLLSNSIINNFTFEEKPVRVRVRFQVDYDADIDHAKKAALEAIGSVAGVIDGTPQIVVRSLWDDSRGHLLAGVLLEGRYRIEDVRRRTVIRSKVLESILKALKSHGVPFPAQPVRVMNGGDR
jgi:small-conductance mechanosensitive channel